MSTNFKKVPLSRKHIFWTSIVIGMLFTYTGVEEPFFQVIGHLDFIITFIVNSIQAFLLIYLIYWLHLNKKIGIWLAILISLGLFYCIEFIAYQLSAYEQEDITELLTNTLPFGSLIILAFNFYYHLIRKQQKSQIQVKETKAVIWLDTISGRVQLMENTILYAFLTDTNLEINTKDATHKTFYSLKQLEDLLVEKAQFFRLNKQFLSRRDAILSYKSLSDGRIEISLSNERSCIVSKNKASSFKKWLDES